MQRKYSNIFNAGHLSELEVHFSLKCPFYSNKESKPFLCERKIMMRCSALRFKEFNLLIFYLPERKKSIGRVIKTAYIAFLKLFASFKYIRAGLIIEMGVYFRIGIRFLTFCQMRKEKILKDILSKKEHYRI